MQSPPPNVTHGTASAATGTKGSRLVRQSSLPSKPSPKVSTPNTQLGSLNVPPPAGEEASSAVAQSSAADRSPRRSPTTGLHRAPLPWMCGHLREASPPPLFAQHAQNLFGRYQHQNRFIRQSSLGPDSTVEISPHVGTTAHSSARIQPGFQRQQSLPPPQRPQQEQPQKQPVRLQTQNKQQQPQAQFNPPLLHSVQPQLQQPHAYQPQVSQQPQPKSQPIRIQNQGHLNQHSRVIPIQVQQVQQPKQKPRERIIPIMIEGESPPKETSAATHITSTSAAANSSTNERFIPIHIDEGPNMNNAQNNFQQMKSCSAQQLQQPGYQSQSNWNSSLGSTFNHSSAFSHPVTTLSGGGQGGAFLPYNSLSSPSTLENNFNNNNNTNNNPLDALHQMQQSLAQLNSGLEK